jgi:dipeptidase E
MKQIIAMGGGGFGARGAASPLDSFIIECARNASGKEKPKVCFVPTASGQHPDYITHFEKIYSERGLEHSWLSFFSPHTADLHSYLLEQDIIYVGGGNTKSMLALWREWEVDKILREAWEQGTVLCGGSAGMICWFEEGNTDSITGSLTALPCLGFLRGSACPHYDGEINRRPSYQNMVASGEILPGLAADNGVGLYYVGTELREAIAEVDGASAYRVERDTGSASGFRETDIGARRLPEVFVPTG